MQGHQGGWGLEDKKKLLEQELPEEEMTQGIPYSFLHLPDGGRKRKQTQTLLRYEQDGNRGKLETWEFLMTEVLPFFFFYCENDQILEKTSVEVSLFLEIFKAQLVKALSILLSLDTL